MRGPAPATNAAGADPPAAAPPPPAASSAQLAEVLDLCRGPTDERRLVGLLLATKLLPGLAAAGAGVGGSDGGADASALPLRAVCDAVGLQFMERLMLPLRQPGVGGIEVGA